MHLDKLNPSPSSLADWSDVAALQQRLAESVQRMSELAGDVGLAKHVLEYDGDRRKRALARAMKAPLAGGSSATAAEAEARASESYAKELAQLGVEHANAEQMVMDWEALRLQWETARSLLSLQRETVKHL